MTMKPRAWIKTKGEHLYVDTSSIKARNHRGTIFWNLIVDEAKRTNGASILNQRVTRQRNGKVPLLERIRDGYDKMIRISIKL